MQPEVSNSYELVERIVRRCEATVPRDVKSELRDLLESYSDVLFKSQYDLGYTDVVKHRIDSRPIRQSLHIDKSCYSRTPSSWLMTDDERLQATVIALANQRTIVLTATAGLTPADLISGHESDYRQQPASVLLTIDSICKITRKKRFTTL